VGILPRGPLPGVCPGPAGDLKRCPDPSPTLLEAALYHGYPARKHKHQNVVAIEKYILNTPVAGMLLYGLTRSGRELTIYRTRSRGEHLTITH
jgi:hypothetical protein